MVLNAELLVLGFHRFVGRAHGREQHVHDIDLIALQSGHRRLVADRNPVVGTGLFGIGIVFPGIEDGEQQVRNPFRMSVPGERIGIGDHHILVIHVVERVALGIRQPFLDADKITCIGHQIGRSGFISPVGDIGSGEIEADELGTRQARDAVVVGQVILQGAIDDAVLAVQQRLVGGFIGNHHVVGIPVEADQHQDLGRGTRQVHVKDLRGRIGVDLPALDLPVHEETLVQDAVHRVVDGDVIGAVVQGDRRIILVKERLSGGEGLQGLQGCHAGGGMRIVGRGINVILHPGYIAFLRPVLGEQMLYLFDTGVLRHLRQVILLEPRGGLRIGLLLHEDVQRPEIILAHVVPGIHLVILQDIRVRLVLSLGGRRLPEQARQDLQPFPAGEIRFAFPGAGRGPREHRECQKGI